MLQTALVTALFHYAAAVNYVTWNPSQENISKHSQRDGAQERDSGLYGRHCCSSLGSGRRISGPLVCVNSNTVGSEGKVA
jgi:hypothetical protein